MTVLSDQLHLHPDQLGAYWMPFTSNRHFKAAPRMLAIGRWHVLQDR